MFCLFVVDSYNVFVCILSFDPTKVWILHIHSIALQYIPIDSYIVPVVTTTMMIFVVVAITNVAIEHPNKIEIFLISNTYPILLAIPLM